jgi:hypothetical protein
VFAAVGEAILPSAAEGGAGGLGERLSALRPVSRPASLGKRAASPLAVRKVGGICRKQDGDRRRPSVEKELRPL